MINKEEILKTIKDKGIVKSSDLVASFGVSRQYIARLLAQLVSENEIVKVGSTRGALYATESYLAKNPQSAAAVYTKTFKNTNLEEHKIVDEIKTSFSLFDQLPENIKSIFEYAFSEMLNNAIEHSHSKTIKVKVSLNQKELSFVIDDFGIGVFRSIMNKRGLKSELEAIQDLLKGKTTTAPKLHSGEGIFFTSKVGDQFALDSFGYQLMTDNTIDDLFVGKTKGQKQGTRVTFKIGIDNKHHLNDVFKEYTNVSNDGDYGFDKTEIKVRLYTMGGVYISRSQARRVLAGLEKFKVIVMDFDKVPTVGQAFTDEIYRVFKNKYPEIKIENINTNEAVNFMVERAKKEAEVGRT
ncbi:DUF4325 domain-containing protein [Candidatus Beckwithbacteria bacterium]|nr:DUF4325 domain-containing protein [Candidatus Beckwithbacteria bacterium]